MGPELSSLNHTGTEDFVRHVLEDIFGQEANEEMIRDVARKIEKTIPADRATAA